MPATLENILNEKYAALRLKETALNSLEQILQDPGNYEQDKDFLAGYERGELRRVFDGYSFELQLRHYPALEETGKDNYDNVYADKAIGS